MYMVHNVNIHVSCDPEMFHMLIKVAKPYLVRLSFDYFVY